MIIWIPLPRQVKKESSCLWNVLAPFALVTLFHRDILVRLNQDWKVIRIKFHDSFRQIVSDVQVEKGVNRGENYWALAMPHTLSRQPVIKGEIKMHLHPVIKLHATGSVCVKSFHEAW